MLPLNAAEATSHHLLINTLKNKPKAHRSSCSSKEMDLFRLNIRLISTVLCVLNFFTCFMSGDCADGDWRMLARENSSVSLFCDAIFKQGYSTATWYKDGKPIGHVDDNTNLFLGPIPSQLADSLESIPDMGFLIIPTVSKRHEGRYACYNGVKDSSESGRDVDLRVAFLGSNFSVSPGWSVAPIAAPITIKCSPPNGFPTPTVSWSKDGHHVHNSGRVRMLEDGSLHISDVRPSDGGEYSCWARNIVGNRVVKGYLLTDSKDYKRTPPAARSSVSQHRWLLWGHLLWFIVGMVLTASIVLVYALLALTCMRPRTNTVQPRALDAPAFTKIAHPILPVPV